MIHGNINPEELGKLSYYDFCLICRRIYTQRKKEENFWITMQVLFRRIYTLLFNVNSKTKKKAEQIWPIDGLDRKLNYKDFKQRVKDWENSEVFKQRYNLN